MYSPPTGASIWMPREVWSPTKPKTYGAPPSATTGMIVASETAIAPHTNANRRRTATTPAARIAAGHTFIQIEIESSTDATNGRRTSQMPPRIANGTVMPSMR